MASNATLDAANVSPGSTAWSPTRSNSVYKNPPINRTTEHIDVSHHGRITYRVQEQWHCRILIEKSGVDVRQLSGHFIFIAIAGGEKSGRDLVSDEGETAGLGGVPGRGSSEAADSAS
jgi:hypothetical protein